MKPLKPNPSRPSAPLLDPEQWRPFEKPGIDLARRAVDLVLAFAALPALAAVLTGTATLGLLSQSAPKLKRIKTLGREGRVFDRYLLDSAGAPFDTVEFSKLLALLSIEKAPLLLNILRGDMGFVGPRPLSPEEAAQRPVHEQSRYAVRPGLTDPVRLRSRTAIATGDAHVLESVYLTERHPVRDLVLLAQSLPSMFLGAMGLVSTDQVILLDVGISNLTLVEAAQRLGASGRKRQHVTFVDSRQLNRSGADAAYKESLQGADLVLPQGAAIHLAAAIVGAALTPDFTAGELLEALTRMAPNKPLTAVWLGEDPAQASRIPADLSTRFPGLRCVDALCLPPDADEFLSEAVVATVERLAPDLLLVDMDAPRADLWLARHLPRFNVKAAFAVSDLLDKQKRLRPSPPLWAHEVGLDWLWRLAQQPRREVSAVALESPRLLAHVVSWYVHQTRTMAVDRFTGFSEPAGRLSAELELTLRRALWWAGRDGVHRLKRGVDIVGAASGIALLSPLFLTVIAAIKLEDQGPIFYTSKRVGRHGKEFDFYKFRSMVANADKLKDKLIDQNESAAGVIFKMKDDPRITRVGRFIRRTSIDELPQLYNVLRGDMSLVGPRPPLPREVAQYKVGDRYRLEVTPGLTCIWQVSGRSNLDFRQQVELDRQYIQAQSLLSDLKLIVRTIPAVLGGEGSY